MSLKKEPEILESIAALRRVIAQLEKLLRETKNNSNLTINVKEMYIDNLDQEIKNVRIIIGTLLWMSGNYEKGKKTSHLGLHEIGYLIDEAVNKMKNGEQFDFKGE